LYKLLDIMNADVQSLKLGIFDSLVN